MNHNVNPTIILGGGFVGLLSALHLSKQNYSQPLLLIDPRDHFVFKPLLYELLTGEMHPEQICPPYQNLLSGTQITFIQDTVQSVDLPQKRITLTSGIEYNYTNLVLALGSQTAYFNITGAKENTLPFTSASEALNLKARIQDCLQTALTISDPQQREKMLTVAIIGAGPAGVELACTLADIMPVWYDQLGGDYAEVRVVLINRSNEILKGDINSRLRQVARHSLSDRTISVELVLDAAVSAITPMGVEYKCQDKTHFLPTMAVAWTAGTEPHFLIKDLPVSHNKRGQIKVNYCLQLPEFPEVFAGGDIAEMGKNPQPSTAQVAYQQGKAIADNLQALALGNPLKIAQVNLRGTLMKLGVGEGVANLFDRVEIKGEVGHLIRQGTYLELLPKPLHNFKVTTEWLTDELLQRHQTRSLHPNHYEKTPIVPALGTVLASLTLAFPLIWHAAQPEAFKQQMTGTGIPHLIQQLTPKNES